MGLDACCAQPPRGATQSRMEEEKESGLPVWGALVLEPWILEVGQAKRKACSYALVQHVGTRI